MVRRTEHLGVYGRKVGQALRRTQQRRERGGREENQAAVRFLLGRGLAAPVRAPIQELDGPPVREAAVRHPVDLRGCTVGSGCARRVLPSSLVAPPSPPSPTQCKRTGEHERCDPRGNGAGEQRRRERAGGLAFFSCTGVRSRAIQLNWRFWPNWYVDRVH